MDNIESQSILKIENEYYIGKFDGDLYAKISKYGKYGIININANIIIPCIYDDILPVEKDYNTAWQRNLDGFNFSCLGYAAVLENGKWGVINIQNELILNCEFTKINYFSEGLFIVNKEENCGCIDLNGNIVVPFKFTHIYGFINGYAVFYYSEITEYLSSSTVAHYSHRYGVLSRNGEIVLNPVYTKILQLSSGVDFIAGETPSLFSLRLDIYGNEFPIDEIEYIYNFRKKYAIIRAPGDKYGAINKLGEIIIPAIYDGVSDFKNKFFLAYSEDSNTQYFLINYKGEIINQTDRFSRIEERNGYLFFHEYYSKYASKIGLLDNELNILLPANYFDLKVCRNGLFLVRIKKHDEKILIDIKGNVLLKTDHYVIDDFKVWYEIDSSKLILASIDQQLCAVNSLGSVVKKFNYSFAFYHKINSLDNDYLYTILNGSKSEANWIEYVGKWGLMDSDFNEIIAPKYDHLTLFEKNNELVLVGKGKLEFPNKYETDDGATVSTEGLLYGAINFKDEIIIPFQYNRIEETDYNLFVVSQGGEMMFDREDYEWYHKGGKKGVIDIKGKLIVPLIYKNISIQNYIFAFKEDPLMKIPIDYDVFDLFGNKIFKTLPHFVRKTLNNF